MCGALGVGVVPVVAIVDFCEEEERSIVKVGMSGNGVCEEQAQVCNTVETLIWTPFGTKANVQTSEVSRLYGMKYTDRVIRTPNYAPFIEVSTWPASL